MPFTRSFVILLSVLAAPWAVAGAADAQADPVSIVDAAAQARGERSPVLVLGTAHLSSLPADFDRSRFDTLLDRLAAWRPDAIAVESLSGAQCDYLRAYAFAYPETAETYCSDPEPARASLGQSAPQAEEEIGDILGTPAANRPARERRRLATLFLAIGDPSSALVQWLRLDETERHPGGALTEDLVGYLEQRRVRMNENVIIAVALAVRLGQERVYPVDDHTGDRASGPGDDDVYGAEISAIWDNDTAHRRRTEGEEWDARIAGEGNIIDWYRYLNSVEQQRLAMRSDFAAAAGADVPSNSGRRYLAYWETRNLRMVANLREVIGSGRRVLAIVGASHKPYYERYLGMTSDIEIVDVVTVLND